MILGMSGEEVKAMEDMAKEKGEAGLEELEGKIKQCYFNKVFMLTVRARLETYNGEPRGNVTVVNARLLKDDELDEIKDLQPSLAPQSTSVRRSGQVVCNCIVPDNSNCF